MSSNKEHVKPIYNPDSLPDFRVGNRVELHNPTNNDLKGKIAIIKSAPQVIDWAHDYDITAYAVEIDDDITQEVVVVVTPEIRPVPGTDKYADGQRVGVASDDGNGPTEFSAVILSRREAGADFAFALKLDSGDIVIRTQSQIIV